MERKIPFKNYIILSIILIITIVTTIIFFKSYNNNSINLLANDNYLRVINYNEIDNYLVENKDVVMYISSQKDDDIIKFEKKFKKVVTKYALNNTILNLNVSNKNYIKIKEDKIVVPSFAIYKDGKIVSSFNLKKNNYDINKLTEYLKEEMIISD